MQDEKGAGHGILLHEVLTLVHLAELEFLEKEFLDFFILDQRGKGEMGFKAFEDEGLVVDGLFLDDLYEIFIDLVVVDGSQCSHFSGLSFALNDKMDCTSSTGA
jgi:hypothetical protein